MAPSNRRGSRNNARPNQSIKVMVAKEFSKMILKRQEHKVFSTQVSGASISTAGAIVPLTTAIIEGDDINMRSGTTIRMLHQTFKFTSVAITDSQSMRFIIFRDLFNTGTFPTVTDVLPTTGILSHFSDTREIQQKRYHILLDKIVDVSLNGEAVKTNRAEMNFRGNVNYNAATNVTAANGRGATFLLIIGDKNTGVYNYDWQCVYTDS